MRLGLLLIPCTIALLAAAACSSAQPALGGGPAGGEESENPVPTRTNTNGTAQASTCLGKVGLAFEKSACNTCMSEQSCCQATIACFQGSTKTECATLQECMSACGGSGTGTGGGTGGGDSGTGTEAGTGPTTNAAAKNDFVTKVYPSLSGTCAGCHSAGGAGGQFFGASGDATYPIFKNQGFDKANSLLLQKGAHQGPALTATQKTLINEWVGLEASGGGGTGTGAGDSGAGDGGGSSSGSAAKLACQNTCRANHPAAVAKWDSYNTCVSKTCASSCL